MQFTDPHGIVASGNLPKIANAFRSTGNVCVERTLRILNKSRAGGSVSIHNPEELTVQVQNFGLSFMQKMSANPSTDKKRTRSSALMHLADDGYVDALANASGGLLQK